MVDPSPSIGDMTAEVIQSHHMTWCRQALQEEGAGEQLVGKAEDHRRAAIKEEESGASSAWCPDDSVTGNYRPVNQADENKY